MSNTPNPALVAAVPIINNVIDQLIALVNTTLTGDPLQIPARLDASIDIFIGNVKLQLPALAVAEVGVVQTDIVGGLTALKTRLTNAAAPAAASAPAAKTGS